MARETAAEKRARMEQERAERDARVWTEFTAQYPVRFANVLFKFMELSYAQFSVRKVDDETYEFEHNFTNEQLSVTPPVNYDWEVLNNLDRLEAEVREHYEELEEENRKRQARVTALAKLTTEERELLGL